MANLQSYLGPEGVDVKMRETFHSTETGKQIGELDIAIRGEFGTSEFFVGIECRDRPANRPQGIPWIREIVGKRSQLGLDKMIAVSSTGFTADAEKYAEAENIELIALSALEENSIKDWLSLFEMTVREKRTAIAGFRFELIDSSQELPVGNFSPKRMTLIISPDAAPRSLFYVVKQRFDELGTSAFNTSLRIPAPLSIELDGLSYPLQYLAVNLITRPHIQTIKVLFNACKRLSDKKTIALTGTVRVTLQAKRYVLVIIVKKDRERETISWKLHAYDETGKETPLPQGQLTIQHIPPP